MLLKGEEIALKGARPILKRTAGKLNLPEYFAPDKSMPTVRRMGLIPPPKQSIIQKTGKQFIYSLKKTGYKAKLTPKLIKAKYTGFKGSLSFKKAKFTLKHPKIAKAFQMEGGLYKQAELETPYKTYGTAESMHPLYPERRLWYAREIITKKTSMPELELLYKGKKVTNFTEEELTKVLRIDKKGWGKGIQVKTKKPGIITQEEYVGIPGKMKLVKTDTKKFEMFGKLVLKDEGKRSVLSPLRKTEGVSEFYGTLEYKQGGFKVHERIYGEIASMPSLSKTPVRKFPKLYTKLGKGAIAYDKELVESTKFFDVRAKTYVRGLWKGSKGWARITPTADTNVQEIAGRGFTLKDTRLARMGLPSKSQYSFKGYYKEGGIKEGLKGGIAKDIQFRPDVAPQKVGIQIIGEDVVSTVFNKPSVSLSSVKPVTGAEGVGAQPLRGGLTAKYYSPYTITGKAPPIGLNKPTSSLDLVNRPRPAYKFGTSKTAYTETGQLQDLRLGQMRILVPSQERISASDVKVERQLQPQRIMVGELGSTQTRVERISKVERIPKIEERVATKTEIGQKIRQTPIQKVGYKLQFKTGFGLVTGATPVLSPEVRPVAPVRPIPPSPIDKTPPPIIPRGGDKYKLDFGEKPKYDFKLKKQKAKKSKEPIEILASPFKVQRSQIEFGTATHPRYSKKLYRKGILTGWRLPTVEQIEVAKGARKKPKGKYEWSIGKNVKLGL
jgi:hypothetical protein